MKGSYTIVIRIHRKIKTEVGSLGELSFSPGFYAYNGSAFGPGGLKRVQRHKDKSKNGGSPHWHVDYLLIRDEAEVVGIFQEEGSDHECSLSNEMRRNFGSMSGFGCSDCGCNSHLFYSEDKSDLVGFLESFYS